MTKRHVVIVGGGLAGLSAGCYALAAGFRTTIIEHNRGLGGVCTTWSRGDYEIDGCIHWLTGGPFDRVYRELGIFPSVATRVIERFVEVRDVATGLDVSITRDLDALVRDLGKEAPEDRAELERLVAAARKLRDLDPGIEPPAELASLRDRLRQAWELRQDAAELFHFRGSVAEWAESHLVSPRVRRFFTSFLPPEAPALFLAMQLGYLERGDLSRPVGGTAAFRDALIKTYRRLGGEVRMHSTVDEIIVDGDRARGVRLDDGRRIDADLVVSTSSAPETVRRLLGGRYDADRTERRLAHWKLFQPIVLASFGVALPLSELPAMMQLEGLAPTRIAGRTVDRVYLRICNDDPCYAPAGHCVVQAMIEADFDHWAALGGGDYAAEKDRVATSLRDLLEPWIPGLSASIRMTDVATPLTFWRAARSYRGAYEGWIPSTDATFGHVDKKLAGLAAFYMAGQWVEPGGGVPMATLSGRQVVQLICADEGREFVAEPAALPDAAPPVTLARGPDVPILVLFGTREGHTRRIAEHIGGALRLLGHYADVRDVRADPPRSLEDYRAVFVAASVHRGEHDPEIIAYVRAHRAELERLRTALVTVSLTEAGAEDPDASPAARTAAREAVEGVVQSFLAQTSWHPDAIERVAGALAYTQYGALTKVVMQLIALRAGASTDTSRDHDYTDWAGLDAFVEGLCETLASA